MVNSNCPRCGSDNTVTFQMAYGPGASAGTFSAISYARRLGLITTGGRSSQMTALAARAAPPRRPPWGCWWMFALYVICGVGTPYLILKVNGGFPAGTFTDAQLVNASNLLSVSAYAAILLAGVSVYLWRRRNYGRALRQWECSWLCLRCGHAWLMEPPAPQALFSKSFR